MFSTWVKTELYFGLSYVNSTTGDTEEVTIEGLFFHLQKKEILLCGLQTSGASILHSFSEFNQFVSDVVTPLYPDGLTLLPGKGQWQSLDSGQIIQVFF